MTRTPSATAGRPRIGRAAAALVWSVGVSVLGALWLGDSLAPTAVRAQDPPPAAAKVDPADTTPRPLELTTKDQVILHATFYPGRRGKQSVPVILLHGWDGPRGAGASQDLAPLALALQQAGHAVVVPDLRGHGRSTVRRIGTGGTETIEREKLRPVDIQAMILDVEAVRSFLVEQNNAGQLNLELLCVIGFEMGSVVALNWIHYDWSVPSWPTFKQGQDVKAFVLVSPEQTFKGASTRRALANPIVRGDLSAMLIYGQDDPASSTGERLYTSLKRSHRPVADDPAEAEKFQDLFLVELETSLRGTKLLTTQTLPLTDSIQQFIQRRLVNRQEAFPWRDRSRP